MKKKLRHSHIRVLETILLLNERDLYPTFEGVFKVLTGVLDEETKNLIDLKSFSTSISYSSKSISLFARFLLKNGFLINIYHNENDSFYLEVTSKGKDTLKDYYCKHNIQYVKKYKKIHPSIVHIEK